MEKIRVLIIDDEEEMRQLIQIYLENSGFVCEQASNGEQTYRVLDHRAFDLILLDVMLPGEDGFQICKTIRATTAIPVIFLSAKGEEWDKVKGLEIGADDYIVKPFSPGELVARIHAVLRRSGGKVGENSHLHIGAISIDQKARKVMVHELVVNLTLKEYEMLLFFIRNSGQALSREQLLENVWGMDYNGSLRTVDTHVKTLRMKLGKADYVATVWGIGYKFEVQRYVVTSNNLS